MRIGIAASPREEGLPLHMFQKYAEAARRTLLFLLCAPHCSQLMDHIQQLFSWLKIKIILVITILIPIYVHTCSYGLFIPVTAAQC